MEFSDGLIGLILMGLLEDGGHHKQWALNEIMKYVLGIEEYEELRKKCKSKGFEWEEGIPI